jgi:hypothetical protein
MQPWQAPPGARRGKPLSFLDEPDEPVRTRRRPPRGQGVDRQTLMVRRTIAAGAALIVLILLVLLVRGCLDARKESAMQDYANDSAELLKASQLEGNQLFKVLEGPGGTDEAVNIGNSLNGYRVEAANLVDRAKDLDPPGEMNEAQRSLLDVLELRADGLARVSDAVRVALGDRDRREGTRNITGAMQIFLASDTLEQVRFQPALDDALKAEGLTTPRLPEDGFVPDVEWLDASFVADRVNGLRSGAAAGNEAATPGLHGNGLAAVALGGTPLTPGATGTTIQLANDLAFDIQVQNQGENTENDVNVRVTVGRGNDAIDLEEPIDTIAVGEIQTVTIPLSEQPPTGQNVPIKVEVEPVPGEQMTDNNVQEFSVIFTR